MVEVLACGCPCSDWTFERIVFLSTGLAVLSGMPSAVLVLEPADIVEAFTTSTLTLCDA